MEFKESVKTYKSEEIMNMTAELEEYYECAGFEDFYNRSLKVMSDEQIRDYYRKTFNEKQDHELEMWERKQNRENEENQS